MLEALATLPEVFWKVLLFVAAVWILARAIYRRLP